MGGFAKVFPTQSGIAIEKHAHEDQRVKAGDVLYVLSLDRPGQTGGDSLARISRQVEQRRASLTREPAELGRLHAEQRSALTHKRELFQNELRVLDQSIAGQRNRIALADAARQRINALADWRAVRLRLAAALGRLGFWTLAPAPANPP